jgi:hypothetical protein
MSVGWAQAKARLLNDGSLSYAVPTMSPRDSYQFRWWARRTGCFTL